MPDDGRPSSSPSKLKGLYDAFGRMHSTVQVLDGERLLQRIVGTLSEMLHDRGCAPVAFHGLAAIERDEPLFVGHREDRPTVVVYFATEERVGVKTARALLEDARKRADDPEVVVVSLEGPTPYTKRELEGNASVQFQIAKYLTANRARHRLVPKHTRLTPTEREALGVADSALPRILDTDPVVQYYMFPVGSVVRIDRSCGSEVRPYFRLVVASS